jgi:hypothetical protein
MVPEGSLTCSQKPAIEPYPELHKSSPQCQNLYVYDTTTLPPISGYPKWRSLPFRFSWLQFRVHFSALMLFTLSYVTLHTCATYGVTMAPSRAIALQVPTPTALNGVGYTWKSHSKQHATGKTVQFIINLIYEILPLTPTNQGSNPSKTRYFPAPKFPDQLQGPPSLLSNRYQGLLCGG